MVSEMKSAILLFCALSVAAAAEIGEAHSVYLMPMNHSLDQFIASRLTRMHVFQVVTDPAKADAVITDQVGEQLEDRMADLFPAPKTTKETEAAETAKSEAAKPETAKPETAKPDAAKPAEAPKPGDTAKTEEAAKPSDSASKSAAASRYVPKPIFGDTANKPEKRGYMSTSGHGHGTIFLVDVKSRQVLWSAFDRPKSSTPRELDHTAARIVQRLKDDLEPKTKK